MKKAFLLLCTLLLVLGSLLPLAGYRLAKAVLGEAAASSEVPASSALPAPGGSLPGTDTGSPETAAFTGDAEVFLIDAVKNLGLNGREIPMVKGDATSYAIAASSIIAKVTRDRQMLELDKQYPQYGFARNKGYGTPEHIAALQKYGATPLHRRTFIGQFVPVAEN